MQRNARVDWTKTYNHLNILHTYLQFFNQQKYTNCYNIEDLGS